MERRDFWGMRFWIFEPRRREGAKDGVLGGVLVGWVWLDFFDAEARRTWSGTQRFLGDEVLDF